jgi:hypothetical protein
MIAERPEVGSRVAVAVEADIAASIDAAVSVPAHLLRRSRRSRGRCCRAYESQTELLERPSPGEELMRRERDDAFMDAAYRVWEERIVFG